MIGLKRKFGPTLADVIHYEENAEKECTSLKNLIYENKEMQEKYKLLTEAVMKKAEALNRQRILTGCEFTEKIISLLQDMGMDDPRMTLHLIPAAAPVSSGVEEMELYFSANRGESLRSMKETASGGELSRIALAIEIVISRLMRGQTLVFDEIDVGISGKIGIQIAKKIKILSNALSYTLPDFDIHLIYNYRLSWAELSLLTNIAINYQSIDPNKSILCFRTLCPYIM